MLSLSLIHIFGDLIVTATSMHSRNNRAGILIGKGETPEQAVKEVGMVVEGMNALPAALELAAKYQVEMPIVQTVNAVVNKGMSAAEAVRSLMDRDPVSYTHLQSEFEALVLEASQIKAHTPKYNILLKDDKGYSYIKVTREAWPRLSFVLQKEEDDAEYIGPYTSSFAARQMAETALDAFLLPRCNKRFPQDIGKGRPCLNAHIGKCMAVCSGKISCENYNQAVKNAVHLIRYGKKDILKTLNERMLEASDRLEFETAALLRDQINAITKVTAGQKVVVDPEVEMDVVALAGTPSSVCAAVLRFREGRLTDKREFLFHDTADIAAVREEFLPRYYLDDEQIPKIIAVDELPPDSEALQRALNEKRGSEVQLYVPQRGDKAHLVEMAHTNAVERLARESDRYAREEKLLDEMAQVLGLSKPPRTIESYDISNWGDGTSVCGMVTFRDGKPYKACLLYTSRCV